MRKTKYFHQLEQLLKMPFFTSKDALRKGIPSYELSYYCKIGVIERVAHGVYRPAHDNKTTEAEWENLVIASKTVPEGVICLISALSLYDLTDQIMRQIWIAIPNNAKKTKKPNFRIIRLRNMSLGKTKIKLGKTTVNIFDRERTIIDAFRLLSHEVAIKASCVEKFN